MTAKLPFLWVIMNSSLKGNQMAPNDGRVKRGSHAAFAFTLYLYNDGDIYPVRTNNYNINAYSATFATFPCLGFSGSAFG